MNFLQFFIWGAWLCTLGLYMTTPVEDGGLAFDGALVGSVFALSGIASLIMPALIGVISDKWVNAERLMGLLHGVGAVALFSAAFISNYDMFKIAMLVNMLAYMPTLSLSYTVAYNALDKAGLDRVKDYPPIRVWGTVGFIVAMWIDNFTGFSSNNGQLIMAGCASVVMAFYCFTLPACPPAKAMKGSGIMSMLGLDALVLFKNYRTAVFLLFSFLLGAALQVTNMYGVPFLDSFKLTHPDAWAVKYSVILSSLSQVSETLFILAIPFFMSRYGIKKVMLISFTAWVLRFGFFAIGGPEGFPVVFFILSMIVYGMAFDFFNVSGSLHRRRGSRLDQGERARYLYDDDQRTGLYRRRLRCRLGDQATHGRRHDRLDLVLGNLCGLCSRDRRFVCFDVPLQTPKRRHKKGLTIQRLCRSFTPPI